MNVRTFFLLALLVTVTSCEHTTAPTLLVYADRAVVVPEASHGWASASVGGAHTCAIRADGSLYCWGSHASGQLGVGQARGRCSRFLTPCEGGPRAVASPERFLRVSAGQRHTCAIAATRALYCWGENLQFQVGVQGAVFVTTPAAVLPAFQFLDVSAGATHTCAVRTNGVVYCWGEGQLGGLGRGDSLSSVLPAPVVTSQRFTQVGAGRLETCAVATDGGLWCWGAEWESSDGTFDYFHSRLLPHQLAGVPLMREVSLSSSTACATTIEGLPMCWQSNTYAQLGLGNLTSVGDPTPVLTDARFSNVSAGITQTCGTTAGGTALCWGNNSFGQLGVPRPGQHCGPAFLECSTTPIGVFGEQQFRSVVTGFGNHTCGLTVQTAILCWGLGTEGQLGDGYSRDRQSLPVGVLAPAP